MQSNQVAVVSTSTIDRILQISDLSLSLSPAFSLTLSFSWMSISHKRIPVKRTVILFSYLSQMGRLRFFFFKTQKKNGYWCFSFNLNKLQMILRFTVSSFLYSEHIPTCAIYYKNSIKLFFIHDTQPKLYMKAANSEQIYWFMVLNAQMWSII